jgi:nucleoside-diphosphate-sugar epimerase
MTTETQTSAMPDAAFWKDKRVLLTGHTGFKGGWAALWLTAMGAKVTGRDAKPLQHDPRHHGRPFEAAEPASGCVAPWQEGR